MKTMILKILASLNRNLRNPMNHAPSSCHSFLFLLVVTCFTLLPRAQAVSPPPDGGYGGRNTAEGTNALFSLTTGVWNVAVGFEALKNDTTGGQNTAVGYRALFNNTTGNKSTAYGSQALLNNITGSDNVALGFSTLFNNVIGNRNTGVGYRTLLFNNADDNTAIGWNALYNNRGGRQNTAIGSRALLHGSGNMNTAVGYNALTNNDSVDANVAVGDSALASFDGTSVNDGANTAVGSIALTALETGQENVAVGRRALQFLTDGSNNVVVGWRSGDGLTTGDGNTFIGDRAGTNEGPDVSNVICLGSFGDTQAAGQVTPNRTYIDNIVGVATGGPNPSVNVIIDQDGQLGTVVSSREFKKDIKPMDQVSEAILKLKPVTFHYKNRDVKNDLTQQFGLIAEDVEQVNRDLVVYGKDGKLWSVRYEAVNVMLLNEFIKEHKKVERLKATVAQQQKGMEVLTAQLKEQAAQIQKVSAQIEMGQFATGRIRRGGPALKVVSNKP
jgi:trimeric autotransporter adhesin